ncbi:nuclear transport factor 2 family protein [Erythrobacter sp.]|jgi:hypothetical protein|uniref:nuclear transport factor 2 family protein n=1 Tax=Erythrobacter sp. TaxID=1042 RepID=UPI002ECDB701|nr:nuclear transport factor 2 family protein [Erythrobacter sp.]
MPLPEVNAKLACVLAAGCAAFAMPASLGAQSATEASAVSAPASEQERIAVVQQHIEAYRSGDIDRFVATFAPDAIVRADGFVAMGRDQIKRLYELNFEPGAPQLKVHRKGVDGDLVTVSHGYVLADGQELCCTVSEYRIVDGKVSLVETRG